MITATEITGLFTGAIPANDATCIVFEYRWVLGSTFCAVPVLPPEEYPFNCAALPVPYSTTPSIILRISAAESSDITRCDPCGSGLGSSPPGRNGEAFSPGACAADALSALTAGLGATGI